MRIQGQHFAVVVKFEHVKVEVPKDELANKTRIQITRLVVRGQHKHAERGNRDDNLSLINYGVILVVLPRLLFKSDEFLTVRVVPDSQLELLCISVVKVQIQV